MKDEIKGIRKRLGLSQTQFAKKYQIDIDTLQNWEQGRRCPDGVAVTYLRLIKKVPHEVAQALAD